MQSIQLHKKAVLKFYMILRSLQADQEEGKVSHKLEQVLPDLITSRQFQLRKLSILIAGLQKVKVKEEVTYQNPSVK